MMRKWFGRMISAVMIVVMALGLAVPMAVSSGEAEAAFVAQPANGGNGSNNQNNQQGNGGGNGGGGSVETSILPESWANEADGGGVMKILKLVLNIVVYGLGAAAVLGTVIAGIMYMTARDNESQVAKAKTRLFEVVIGLVAWALMYAVLNWLLPGGLNL